MARDNPKMVKSKHGYVHQGFENDELFDTINPDQQILREQRESTEPEIHYGVIASGNTLFKDTTYRDGILKNIGEECICLEMEAAGLMNNFPCIVIRGICDYTDSHKSDRWQRYAAAIAAAYAKELLEYVPSQGLQETQMAIDLIEEVKNIRSTTSELKNIVEKQESDNRSEKINTWLRSPDSSTNFNKAIADRHKGTGSWFLESRQFKEWKSGKRRHLWLHGIPGCEKTILCSTVIQHLRQNQGAAYVIDFFFDFRDNQKQSFENLVRSFVSQLYSRCKNSRKELDILFSQCEDRHRQPTKESLFETFQHMINHIEEIQIIIDALDECKTRKDLLQSIKQLSNSTTNLKVIATSRAEEEIKSGLKHWIKIKAEFPLARYSAQYWMDHARPAETDKSVQDDILKFFLQQNKVYEMWGKLFNPDEPWDDESWEDGSSNDEASRLKPEIRLAQAVSQFEADLSSDQKRSFSNYRSELLRSAPDPRDVMKLTAEIDLRASGGRCFGPRLTNFLQAVQQFAALGDIIIGGTQNLIACGP
ncbi:hypothetical protein B7463_g10091, partial [Scytalidium lignicola]